MRLSRSLAVGAFGVCLLVGSASPPHAASKNRRGLKTPAPQTSQTSQNVAPGSSTFAQGAPVDKLDPGVRLTNVAEAAGLRFVYQHSPTPEKYFVESVPGGVAVFDYNGDRRPDIFFTNGAKTPALEKSAPIYANRLYRNDGGMRFTDVTGAAGLPGAGYAIGAAAGDFDNDGHVDLFVAGARTSQLYRNRGDGRFEDVTKARASPAASSRSPVDGSTTTMTAASISSSSTTCNGRPTRTRRAATRPAESSSIAIRARSRDCQTACTGIGATARSRTCRREPACRRTSARA